MAELSPAVIGIAIPVVGALIYAFIWFATRNLSRAAKILARAAPLGLIIPVMVYLSAVPTSRPQMASRAPTAAAPPAESQPPRTSPVTIEWSKFRGPGAVLFGNSRPAVEKADFNAPPSSVFRGKAATTATFSEPGEYILRIVANDWSGDGGGGFQCCWTNAQVRISVGAGATNRR